MAAVTSEREQRPLRIGAVCRRLADEFPDVSISKIRYLEDQGLLNPGRTQGGYRLYREEDVERLRSILRLQRDEFMPLRVIREELAAPGRSRRDSKKRSSSPGLKRHLEPAPIDLEELCERSGADPAFVADLEQYRILTRSPDGRFHETDAEIVEVCARLARFGIEPRNLGKFRSAADNQADLLAKAVAADLHAARPERRERGRDDLERLALAAAQLSQLLFFQALRVEVEVEAATEIVRSDLDLASKIRDVPDFPRPGIVFKDVMPLLADPAALREAVERLADHAEPLAPDLVLGAEARGFIIGGALAVKLGCGFVAARKPGKLPWRTVSVEYALEYGVDSLELQADAIGAGNRVLVHDDVLATGGTARAKIDLVEQLGGTVAGAAFLVELAFLGGRERLGGHDVHSLIEYR